MRLAGLVMAALIAPLAAFAQQDGVLLTLDPTATGSEGPVVVAGQGAILRVLDKTVGRSTDLELAVDQTAVLGRIALRLTDCRYPEGQAASEAYAHLEIMDLEGLALFDGWMVASSPALSALEHPRYDVWVLRCNTSSADTGDG